MDQKRNVLALCVLLAAAGAWAGSCAESAPPTPWSRWTTIGGSRVHYADTAPGSDLPVLLILPGFLGSAAAFEAVVEILSRDMRVVIPDLPGFGWSEAPVGGCAVVDRLEFVEAFTDALDLGPVFLAGSSQGAILAVRYAVEHAREVRRLVLLSPFGLEAQRPVVSRMERYDGMLPLLVLLACRRILEQELAKQVRDRGELTEKIVASYRRPFRTLDGRRVVVEVSRSLLFEGFLDGCLPQVTQPTLALAGTEDAFRCAEILGALQRGIPSCTTRRLEGCRHILQLDAPAEVAELVGRFCLAGEP